MSLTVALIRSYIERRGGKHAGAGAGRATMFELVAAASWPRNVLRWEAVPSSCPSGPRGVFCFERLFRLFLRQDFRTARRMLGTQKGRDTRRAKVAVHEKMRPTTTPMEEGF